MRFKEKMYFTCHSVQIILYSFTTLYYVQTRFLWRTEKKNLIKNVVNTVTSSGLSTNEALYTVVCLTLCIMVDHSMNHCHHKSWNLIEHKQNFSISLIHFPRIGSPWWEDLTRHLFSSRIWEIISVIKNNCDILKQTLSERCHIVFFQMYTGEAANRHSWQLICIEM